MNKLRKEILGIDDKIPLVNGREVKYINFDNAASTPPLKRVLNKVNQFMKFYSSIHRGAGFKSRLSSFYYELSREKVGEFVGYDKNAHTVIFGKNTTEAINKLSYRLSFPENAVIIVSHMEHHSNDLPWRDKANVIYAPLNKADGSLAVDSLWRLIEQYKGELFMVSITGASNVTGIINPLKEIARMTHEAGAYFMVDAAQLIPHRKIAMGKVGEGDSFDFVSFSAHKIYAPFGTGVLVSRNDLFEPGKSPEYQGGGTVKIVTIDDVAWDEEPYKDEAGSPNVVGSIALAETINFYNEVGYDEIERVEVDLTRKLLGEFLKIDEIEIYGKSDPYDLDERLGVIPFNIKGISHALVAAVLAYEYGIGVRNGCFCAHPYLKFLLDIEEQAEKKLIADIISENREDIPGAVRVSFGFYNDVEEVDHFLEAIANIIKHKDYYYKKYFLNKKTGEYFPPNYEDDFTPFFLL